MVSTQNLKEMLAALEFEERTEDLWVKQYAIDCLVSVNFAVATDNIKYPDGLIVNDKTTCNFSHNENFVVLECVVRLLDKGYAAEDIELEPKWTLGHGGKGGKADIWVRRKKKGDILADSALLIECKTPGREFEEAWKDTLEDGAQLFSYYAQETKTRFLCLYTSDLKGEVVDFEYKLINVTDNDEYLKTLGSTRNIMTYAEAGNNKELFRVWAKTYQKEFATRGLFENDIQTWDIGKKRYTTDDLKPVDAGAIKKKYNEFATILRKYNVSGHENAFDKLVNLILAKVVDEKENPMELQFYWKGLAWDNDFALQDRLQRLYKVGMENFLGEDVTYIDDKKIDHAFRLFKNDKDATRDAVQKYIRALKFFTNNDFAFIDVHNEHLFYQNAAILKSVVDMLKDIKLKDDDMHGQHQLLGDLFEGFLDQGVKQSEGQFFTPIPYVKFMISSLPLWDLIYKSSEPPQVIDYACGAGHFLNEYAGQIKNYVTALKKKPEEYFAAITGIEKEYRLSKVTKVAAFMYGQDQINVVYGDALSDLSDKGIKKDGSYDLLIANPPYSVKGFLETLDQDDRAKYQMAKAVSDPSKNDDIETFFVERAAQLLGDGGIAAIILPTTVLTKDGIFARCRNIILESFDIIAIAEMGSGTFGKTGTNTATLFMRKKDGDPNLALHARNRVTAWFKGDFTKDCVFDDVKIINRYSEVIGVSSSDYRSLLEHHPSKGLMDSELFQDYLRSFKDETKARKIRAKAIKGDYTEAKREEELSQYVLSRIVEVEKEKLRVFMLVDTNPQPVVIIRSPTKTKAMKTFLGYEWSTKKGDEGIKRLGAKKNEGDGVSRSSGLDAIETPLYNPRNIEDATKINSLIRKNFESKDVYIPEDLRRYVSKISLADAIDFCGVEFDMAIKTVANRVTPKWAGRSDARKLADVCAYGTDRVAYSKINSESYISTDNMLKDRKGVIPYEGEPQIDSVIKYRKGDVLVSNIRPYLRKIWLADRDGGCSPDVLVFRANADLVVNEYLYLCLSQDNFFDFMMAGKNGMKMPRGDKDMIIKYPIPVPARPVQKKIISACNSIMAEVDAQICRIKSVRAEIAKVVSKVFDLKYEFKEIAHLSTELQYGTAAKSFDVGKTPVIRMGNIQNGIIDWDDLEYSNSDADVTKYGLKMNDVLFNRTNSPEHVGKVGLYRGERPAIFAGYLIRIKYKPELINPVYLAYILNSREMREYGFSVMSKSINQANIGGGTLAKYKIPVPPMSVQNKIAEKLEKLEAEIAAANKIIAEAPAKKAAILDEYLR